MASQQGDDIQELKLDVGLIKGDIKTMKRDMANNQKTIIDRMDKFAFVTQKDHDKDIAEINKAIDDIRDELARQSKLVDAGGLGILNKLNSGVTKTLIAIVVAGLVALIGWSIAHVTPGGFQ